MARKKRAVPIPKTLWLTSNDLDAHFLPGICDASAHTTCAEAEAEAERMTRDGYPSHVVGPYHLAPNGGRR